MEVQQLVIRFKKIDKKIELEYFLDLIIQKPKISSNLCYKSHIILTFSMIEHKNNSQLDRKYFLH